MYVVETCVHHLKCRLEAVLSFKKSCDVAPRKLSGGVSQ